MSNPTPETNATPKTLGLLANLILRGVSFQEIAVAESLHLCATAWDADRKRIKELEAEAAGRALMDAEGEAFLPEVVRQLQEHIEALERAGAEVKAAFGLWIPRTEHSIISKYQTDTLAALFSVLRSEEER